MEIELSEDLQHYKESLVLGLTAKQFLFSVLALGVGTGIVLLLYDKIGITFSCYVATPFVVPLALTGFYNYHGLTFWQFEEKMIYFSFFNRPIVYSSTESQEELAGIISELSAEKEKEELIQKKERKKEEKGGKQAMRKKMILTVTLVIAAIMTAAGVIWYKNYY